MEAITKQYKNTRMCVSFPAMNSVILSFLLLTLAYPAAAEYDLKRRKNHWIELAGGYGSEYVRGDEFGNEFAGQVFAGGTLRKDEHLYGIYIGAAGTDDRGGTGEIGVRYGRYMENRWFFVSAMAGINYFSIDTEKDFNGEEITYRGLGVHTELGGFLKLGMVNIGLKYTFNVSRRHRLIGPSLALKLNF